MPYQFMHVEMFSRKPDKQGRNVSFVFAEASRKPEASCHVSRPVPPKTLFGASVDEVEALHDRRAAESAVEVKGGKVRKIRQDQHTLLTVVCSHPVTVDEARQDPSARKDVLYWERKSIHWLRKLYGDQLVSVIRHIDEKQCHIHAYVIPSRPDMKASALHPGWIARRAVEAEARPGEDPKATSKRARAAFKAAMRKMQDGYHRDVAQPCGLTRLGPARRRLTRAEWQSEQVQARALKEVVSKAVQVKESVQRERREAHTERLQAKAMLETAKTYSGLGGRFRAIIDGLRVSKIADDIRRKFAGEIDVLKSTVKSVRDLVTEEKDRRRKVEKEMELVRSKNSELRAQRDRAWTEVQSLRSRFGLDRAPESKMEYRP